MYKTIIIKMANTEVKIECPKCGWEPQPHSLWACSCGTVWNTFDTGGRCPACSKVWEMTQCQSPLEGGCREWSLHLDWYKGLTPFVEKQVEEVNQEIEVFS